MSTSNGCGVSLKSRLQCRGQHLASSLSQLLTYRASLVTAAGLLCVSVIGHTTASSLQTGKLMSVLDIALLERVSEYAMTLYHSRQCGMVSYLNYTVKWRRLLYDARLQLTIIMKTVLVQAECDTVI